MFYLYHREKYHHHLYLSGSLAIYLWVREYKHLLCLPDYLNNLPKVTHLKLKGEVGSETFWVEEE